jgi:hypothetical protein
MCRFGHQYRQARSAAVDLFIRLCCLLHAMAMFAFRSMDPSQWPKKVVDAKRLVMQAATSDCSRRVLMGGPALIIGGAQPLPKRPPAPPLPQTARSHWPRVPAPASVTRACFFFPSTGTPESVTSQGCLSCFYWHARLTRSHSAMAPVPSWSHAARIKLACISRSLHQLSRFVLPAKESPNNN